jgi:hypothetical protein
MNQSIIMDHPTLTFIEINNLEKAYQSPTQPHARTHPFAAPHARTQNCPFIHLKLASFSRIFIAGGLSQQLAAVEYMELNGRVKLHSLPIMPEAKVFSLLAVIENRNVLVAGVNVAEGGYDCSTTCFLYKKDKNE